MNKYIKTALGCLLLILGLGQASAGVYGSEQVLASQQHSYNKQHVLSFVDSDAVQQKLAALGVDQANAKMRIANMTQEELASLNTQMNEMPAGGIVGTVVTVLVVVAVLDLMGITDVYPFIRPI
ncbi:PA2779 family protein [Colwellia sp. 20A7]|uniref:PA2779 family protein n=1 Tax=Colwellia sp. 20A7 TaxID=2689569 RepID=UPI0013594839|nr:PA2779 family protein [Colwellia sp. 20A7]